MKKKIKRNKPKVKTKPKEMEFHFLKTNNYRSFYIDGAFGGITPSGLLAMDLFLERRPTPRKMIHAIEENGKLGSVIEKETKEGIIREIECGLIMNIDTAIKIKDWLDGKINEYNKMMKIIKEKK